MEQSRNNFDDAVVATFPTVVKARVDTSGRRVIEVEASTEEVDSEGDVILQSALLEAASDFLAHGVLDIDHLSELGYRLGIPDPASYIIGRPTEVKPMAGKRTVVVGEISKSLAGVDPVRNRFDDFWMSLQRVPPVVWYASVFGYPKEIDDCTSGVCSHGATRMVIKRMDWRSLALTRNPVNQSLTGPARIITAKSHLAALLLAKGRGRVVTSFTDIGHHVKDITPPKTPDMAASGNYKKAHIKIGGLDIAIETPMGMVRSGKSPDGTSWHARVAADYGYIKRTEGADGDHVDCYIGTSPHMAPHGPVWVIDQVDADTQKFDEHKALIGFPNWEAARTAYIAGFSDERGDERIGNISELPWSVFLTWLKDGDTKKPISPLPSAVPLPEPRAVSKTHAPQIGGTPYPVDMPMLMDTTVCDKCEIHKSPSLAGYRWHFMKCCGHAEGMADVQAHAVMHRLHMNRLLGALTNNDVGLLPQGAAIGSPVGGVV